MNTIELNAILYYADFLSLKTTNHPVTDNCKYYFIHDTPINSAFIIDLKPEFDENNPFFKQSMDEYTILRDKFGDTGVNTFLEDICQLKARGVVNAKQMLQCIHQYSSKPERKYAFTQYYNWLDNQKYYHIVINELGKPEQKECSKYICHYERSSEKQLVQKS